MEEKMIKTFEEKKEHAQLMRNIFGITAVLYIGFIIWIACIHRYEILWFAFNVWLLLVCIAVMNQSEKKDTELVLKYIEYVELRDELIEAISRNNQWISVNDRMPEITYTSIGESKFVFVHVVNKGTGSEWIELPAKYNERLHDWQTNDFTLIGKRGGVVTHWMPIPTIPQNN